MLGCRKFIAGLCTGLLLGGSQLALAGNSPQTTVNASQRSDELQAAHPSVGRLIVKFRDGAGNAHDVAALSRGLMARRADAMTLRYVKSVSAQTHVLRTSQAVSRAELGALAQTLMRDPRVEYAEVDERVYPHFLPNDTFYVSQQGNLQSSFVQAGAANLPNAWGRTAGGAPISGAGVTIAVLDTGYLPHADLAANMVGGYDFVSQDGFNDFTTANDGDGRDASALDPGDWNTNGNNCDVGNSSWHGTNVAGIIGAVGNNKTGIIGVAYGAKILPVRVLGVCGGYTSDTAAAIQWAAGLPVPGVPANPNPAKVINMSFGRTGACSQTYVDTIAAVRNAGSVIVVSTGNDASKTGITQPSNCPGVIAVSANTAAGERADYANVGAGTVISAPGNSIYTTSNLGATVPAGDTYDARSGTSFSAPQVSGVVALLFQIKPSITPSEVQKYLTLSARPYAGGSYCDARPECGAGLLDAFKAVYLLLQAQGIANSAPVLNAIPAQYVLPGGSLQFTASASDADGDDVAFMGSGLPVGANFNAVTGVFTWINAQPAGDYTFVIQPTDGATLGASVSVKISVTTAIPVTPNLPVVPVVPVAPVVPPLSVTPIPSNSAASSGGGAVGGLDAWAGLLFLLLSLWARTVQARPSVGQQQGDHTA